MAATPQEISEILVQQVKTSNLDFSLNETPYSVHISLRKRFARNFSRSFQNSAVIMPVKSTSNFIHVHELIEKNEKVKLELNKTELEKIALKKLVEELENGVESAEK